MKEFKTIEDILDFAIVSEQESVNFYTELAGREKNNQMKAVFLEFAQEEMKHKARLLNIKENGTVKLPEDKVKDLKIADYLVDVQPTSDMTYQDALILAMKKEKKAFLLYTMLSEKVTEPAMKDLFRSLALEESRHKLRFEVEYDEFILREN